MSSPTLTDWLWYGQQLERHAKRANDTRRELEELEERIGELASRMRRRGRGLTREELGALALELEALLEQPTTTEAPREPDNVRQLWIPGARR